MEIRLHAKTFSSDHAKALDEAKRQAELYFGDLTGVRFDCASVYPEVIDLSGKVIQFETNWDIVKEV
jgi:hypothetical protein